MRPCEESHRHGEHSKKLANVFTAIHLTASIMPALSRAARKSAEAQRDNQSRYGQARTGAAIDRCQSFKEPFWVRRLAEVVNADRQSDCQSSKMVSHWTVGLDTLAVIVCSNLREQLRSASNRAIIAVYIIYTGNGAEPPKVRPGRPEFFLTTDFIRR
jgi:hypothetical protein